MLNENKFSWTRFVYKVVDGEKAVTEKECAGSCLADSNSCNVLFFDGIKKNCYLGTLGANMTLVGAQVQSIIGYVELSKVFNMMQKHYTIIQPSFF